MGQIYASWIFILILGCILTFHIQLFALFYPRGNSLEDSFYCHSNIGIFFSNDSLKLPKTEEALLSEWFALPRSVGRLMANRRKTKYYLAIGVAVHHFKPEDDQNGRAVVERTLESLVNKTSTYEKLRNFIVLIIPQNLSDQNEHLLVSLVVKKFLYEINIGFLHVFLPPVLPDMKSLIPGSKCDSRNNDNIIHQATANTVDKEKTWDVNPCLNFESMFSVWPYAEGISENYLHLDDSLEAVSNYVGAVQEFIRIQKLNSKNWGILEFSVHDFVGYVMRSRDIIKFVHFFATTEISHATREETFELYYRLLSQKSRLLRTPEVFQRVNPILPGLKISGKVDGEERRWYADDPPGIVLTNMNHIGKHIPSLVYGSKLGYFKALMPHIGDWIVIVFDDDVELKRVKIRTGEKSVEIPKHLEFVLLKGIFEVSPKVLRIDQSQNSIICADYIKIGDIESGVTDEIANFSRSLWGRKTRCLKLTVTDADGHDIMFHQIAVYL